MFPVVSDKKESTLYQCHGFLPPKSRTYPETMLSKSPCTVGHLAHSHGRRIAWDKWVAASRTLQSALFIAEGSVANMIARNKLQLIIR